MAHLRRMIPNRRLSSKAIQNQLQANIVEDILAKNLKVLTARLVWKTSKRELQNAKLLITNKRNFADAMVAKQEGILYFFSCLTALQERKRKRMDSQPVSDDEEDDEGSDVPTLYPAINYWIVHTPRVEDLERVLFQQLLNSSLDIDELKPIRSRKQTTPKGMLMSTISTCFQDHNNHYVQKLLKESIEYCQKELLRELLHETEVEPSRSSADLTGALVREKTVRIVVCDEGSREKIATVVKGLEKVGCELQVMESPNLPGHIEMRNEENPTMCTTPENKLLVAVRTVENAMKHLNCSLHRGDIYTKPSCATYTYVQYKSVGDFLHQLSANAKLAEILVGQIGPITKILTSESCAVIPQIKIDLNLIEVLPEGTCFSITEKTFVKNAIRDTDVGRLSPRAFVRYHYKEDKVPKPKLFLTGLENSFPDQSTKRHFMRKYYQCLCTGHFQHKTKKLCVIGPKDSGKTTWVAPLQGIIPVNRIATITKERQFSTQCVNDNTQLIFMDEWSPYSLDAETAKKLFQGGFYVSSVKHQKPTTSILKCPFYITAMEVPSFGEMDDPAIQRRLTIFETKSLENPIPKANDWLRRHCMQVFHYLSDELKDDPLFSDDEEDFDDDDEYGDGAVFNDFDKDETSLIQMSEIIKIDVQDSAIGESEEVLYDPKQSLTKDDETSLLKVAVELEPERHQIHHELQRTHGPTSSPDYLRSVMLMISSNMRVLRLSRSQEIQLELLAKENHKEPNAAYDAWLILNQQSRPEFDVDLLVSTYPGMKRYLKKHREDEDGATSQNNDNVNVEDENHADDIVPDAAVADHDTDHNDVENEQEEQEEEEEKEEEEEEKDDDDDDDDENNDEDDSDENISPKTTKGKWLVKFPFQWWK